MIIIKYEQWYCFSKNYSEKLNLHNFKSQLDFYCHSAHPRVCACACLCVLVCAFTCTFVCISVCICVSVLLTPPTHVVVALAFLSPLYMAMNDHILCRLSVSLSLSPCLILSVLPGLTLTSSQVFAPLSFHCSHTLVTHFSQAKRAVCTLPFKV